MPNPRLLTISILLILILTGCAQPPESCPPHLPRDLSEIAAFALDDQLPFQFPLDEFRSDTAPHYTYFCASSVWDGQGDEEPAPKYHAAEDFFLPAGAPVYAMADGKVSFSGPMGGYGWLVIIDHPQANIYSLYGHLSPSRWQTETGLVKKGDLIGYLGDSHENGGSLKNPLEPHLHFGLRAGQRADYPAKGEWRWQAGWISLCPSDLGWLQPSAIITEQNIPIGGFPEPTSAFMAKWGIELLFTSIYLVGGVCMLIFATKKKKPIVLIFSSIFLFIAGFIFYKDGWKMGPVLFVIALLLLAIGAYQFMRNSRTQA